MAHNFVLGLDVGSATIKAAVAESLRDGKFAIRGATAKKSRGMRKGVVVDMEEVTSVIGRVMSEMRQISKAATKNVYLSVGGADVKAQASRGIIAVARANSEIYKDDVERAEEASRALNLSSNRMIIHTLTREFIVDGVGDIRDPLGMVGSRLEVNSLVIDAFAPFVRNLIKCVELSGGSISGLVFNPIAASNSVLSRDQRELGVILIDIGFGTTGIAVYEEDKLLHTKIFPVGAGHITNDLAIALKIPVEVAEKVKISYGYAIAKEVPNRETIDLSKIDEGIKGTPSRRFICEVIESRLVEILELVNNELRIIGKTGQLPAGIVIVGGGGKLPGITELAKNELKLSSQIGIAASETFETKDPRTVNYVESPEFVCVLGLILSEKDGRRQKVGLNGGFAKRILRSILP